MNTQLTDLLHQDSLFKTPRLSVLRWNFIEVHPDFRNATTESVLKIMTPKVTKALPDGWQQLDTPAKAETWIQERKEDSYFYSITSTESKEIIGFLFLYENEESNQSTELRLGYLLTETVWGKGMGSELIAGLLEWSKNTGIIDSISGGVEKDNIGSIKVLEKNGFSQSTEELPDNMLLYQIEFD